MERPNTSHATVTSPRRALELRAALACALLSGPSCAMVAGPGTGDAARPDAPRGDSVNPTMDVLVPDATVPDVAPTTCDAALAALRAYVQANQMCNAAADCEQVSAPCFPDQQDCCVIYLARSRDAPRFAALYAATMSLCTSSGCGCCAAIPAPPGCAAGRCSPAR